MKQQNPTAPQYVFQRDMTPRVSLPRRGCRMNYFESFRLLPLLEPGALPVPDANRSHESRS